MPEWSACLFGAEELRYHQRSLQKLPEIFWLLFGCLLAAPGRHLSRTRLAGMLWPERDEIAARHCLATALWRVRGRLPEDQRLLIVKEEAIELNLTSCWLDSAALESRARRVFADPDLLACRRERERLARALTTYRGSYMPDRQIECLAVERERFHEMFLDALHQLASAEMEAGRFDRARDAARRLCEIEPLREDAQRLLMIAHVRCGNRGLALAQFRALHRLLQQELAVEPMAETRHLADQIAAGALEATVAPHSKPVPKFDTTEPDRALLVAARDHLSRSLELINQTIGD
jgi:DNA-binding SARP family transcriptional activator